MDVVTRAEPRSPAVGAAAAGPAADAARLLVISPGHYLWDERVLRTLDAARRLHRCVLALDRGMFAAARPEDVARVRDRFGGEVDMVLLPHWPRARGVARLTRHLYVRRIVRQAAALAPDVVNVHESGILGLMIAAGVRRALPRARIILDYHDWIPDEVAQSVRNVRALYGPAMAAWMPRLRRMARAVDVAVCISPGQAAWMRDALGVRRTAVVQNVRPAPRALPAGRAEFRRELVWAGHVMRIRRLEGVIDALALLRAQGVDATFSVFGDPTEPDYVQELRDYARRLGVHDALAFHGRFRSDADLAARLGPGAIGVHPAHAERLPTGINRITSGNKFFTYLALGLPVLLDASFENMLGIAREGGAGEAYADAASCAAAARRIWDTPGLWERMSAGARTLAHAYSAEAAVDVLEALFRDTAPAGARG
ncbi:MAG TPA: glycosyltransferase [Longimicrobium sp.]|nr:glycosyltransferase [Longimicrobium sp.]